MTTTPSITRRDAVAGSVAVAALTSMAKSAIAADAMTVMITGSNRGIGLEFVKQYAAKGWAVSPASLASLWKPSAGPPWRVP